jgi:dihydroorotate dehydrogenase (NAD+) catalytic subunit
MAIEITRPGKNSIILDTPVMNAAGTFGFGDVYRGIVKVEKLGAIVTNPVTYKPWHPATGTRVIPLDAGVLVHTGLPNLGVSKTLSKYRVALDKLPLPVIMHVVATTPEHVASCAGRIDAEHAIDAIELGLTDDLPWEDATEFTWAAVRATEKPVIVRVPLQEAYELAGPVVDAGAAAVVIGAPPRGTARDPYSGRLLSGRIYGPLIKPIALRIVGHLAHRLDVPVIGAGGIHSQQDARDYLDAGAVAVQIDSLIWSEPKMLEIIARDLGGLVITRAAGAFPDEWHPGMGETTRQRLQKKDQDKD